MVNAKNGPLPDDDEMVFGVVDIDVVDVKALDGFRISVKLSNGVEGELNLTEYAGKPWFQPWQDRKVFENVWIPPHGGDIRWGDDPEEIDMCFCIIWLYVELTGRPWEELEAEAKAQLAQ